MKLSGSLLLAGLLVAGCSSLETHLAPKTNLSQLKRIYVQQNLNDNHGLDILIVKELQARGIQAESGPLTLMPRDVKTYLVYEDHWEWDFKDAMIAIGFTLRDAATDGLLATASYSRPTAFLKSPAFMVHTAIEGLFSATAKSSRSPAPERPADTPKERGGRRD